MTKKSTLAKITIALFAILTFFSQNANAQIVINEYSCSNFDVFADNFQEYGDWIELYNNSGSIVNIGGYYLSDDATFPTKWAFPAGTVIPANGFLKIWASGRNVSDGENFHTNFKFTQTKPEAESVTLANPSGDIIDQHQLSITQKGHSNGRTPNGSSTWGVFINPTPGSSNIGSSFQRYAEKPVMSVEAGFYTASFQVSMSTTEPGSTIRYTTNGSEPTSTSTIYTTPVTVNSTKVLKAKTFSTNTSILPSLIDYNTYFINENSTIPVVSIAANNLIDLLNGDGNQVPFGSIEYFNTAKIRTSKGYGEFGRHGQDSWVHPQRSLDYKMRDECGYNYALQEKLFSDTDRDEYQKFILRACGDDNYPGIDSSAHVRDDFVQTVSVKSGMSLDERKSARCLVFANGQYWGVYSIREKPNDHDYTKYYYDQEKFDLFYLMLWGNTWAEYGGQDAFDEWYELYDYIMNHSMVTQANFNYVESQFDTHSLVDYMLINSYVVCSDWLNWNVAWWKGNNPNGGHKRWGYMLWDEDATFGHYINYTNIPAQNPYVQPCFQDNINGASDPEGHVTLLNKLRENAGFNQYYISRYADLLNTAFKPENMNALLDSLTGIIAPEMSRHCTRWGGSYGQWNENVDKIRSFTNTRYNVVSNGLKSCYNLTGPYQVVVNVSPPGAGTVNINSLSVTDFPWSGNYYGGMDNRFRAIESNQFYEFDHWETNHHSIQPFDSAIQMKLSLTTNDTLTAVFTARVFADSLVINEINYNSIDTFNPGDWVELYNPMDHELNISNWVFKDEDDLHEFKFATGTIIPSKGFIVIAYDMVAFHNLYPAVNNYVGPMGFGFAGGGELLRLYDNNGTLIDTVNYDDVAPWPLEPDGQGATLELKSPSLDNALGENWKAGSIVTHGTPGEPNSPNVSVHPFDKSTDNMLWIYPNPSRTTTTIKMSTAMTQPGGRIEIYNMSGQKIEQFNTLSGSTLQIDVTNYNPGFYLVRYQNDISGIRALSKLIIR